MQSFIFTVAVTGVSRALILRDRLRGLPVRGVAGPGEERCRIESGRNVLDAVLVQPVGRKAVGAVLICHGIGETVEHWRGAQRLLARHGVATLVFNYSGYGRSTGRVDAGQWELDAVAAFGFLERRVAGAGIWLLGYSLGSGVATAAMSRVRVRGLVLCAGFASLRKAARCGGVPGWMAGLLPDLWDNEAALRRGCGPVLVVHGAEDRLFAPWVARRVAEAAGGTPVVVAGVSHNGPIFDPEGASQHVFWVEVVRWMAGSDHRGGGQDL